MKNTVFYLECMILYVSTGARYLHTGIILKRPCLKEWACLHYKKRICTKEIRSSATAEGASHFNKSSYHPHMYAGCLYAWPSHCYYSRFSSPQSRTQGFVDSHFILVMPAPHPPNTWWSEGIKSGGQEGWGELPASHNSELPPVSDVHC